VNTSLLEQELAPLNARIEQARGTLSGLENELRAAEAELETFSADRLRFDLLRDACNLLHRLDELDAGKLFWGEGTEFKDPAGHIAQVRSRIAGFDGKINGVLEKQADLKSRANKCLDELDCLDDEIRDVHSRDARREEEFAVEREISPVNHEPMAMPWCFDESDRRFRTSLRSAMIFSLLLGIIIRMVTVPAPVRPVVAQIPERLAMMVRQEPRRFEPAKKANSEKKEVKKEPKTDAKPEQNKQTAKAQERPAPERSMPAPAEQAASPKKSASAGVLAFKENFKDLIDDAPVSRLGTEARLSNSASQTAGHALASRSIVSMQGGGGAGGGGGNAAVGRNAGSGGIGNARVGRGVGSGDGRDRLGPGGPGIAQVKSGIAGGTGTKEAKPVTAGGRPSRTDEEIQLLFDRYKAALYRIYNTELRKDPTLRGKMVLRITIEPGGAVSACGVDSTNIQAPVFCGQIVERVKKFNFGPKDGVPTTTILYPIDFLPAR
jgi:hypothetical protein